MAHNARSVVAPALFSVLAPTLALSFAIALALAPAGPLAAREQETNVSGEWNLELEGPQGMVNIVATFVQEEGALSGTLNGPMGTVELNGEIEGADVRFWISVENPNGAFDLMFSAKVEENNKMTGTMDAGGGEFSTTFTGARKEG